MNDTYKVGVVGYGYWGPNLLRNFYHHRQFSVVWVGDTCAERLDSVHEKYPDVLTDTDIPALLDSYPVDVLVISTPVSSHCELGLLGLSHGCHIFLEKPMAVNNDECRQLLESARRHKRVLYVDYTYLCKPEINLMRQTIAAGQLGQRLFSFLSMRLNWGIVRRDIDAIGDLAVHDFAILQHIVPDLPEYVCAHGLAHVEGEPIDQAFVACHYRNGFLAHMQASWYAPMKTRKIFICGDERTIEYDEMNSSHPVNLYECRIPHRDELGTINELNGGLRHVATSKQSHAETLHLVVDDFYKHLQSGNLVTRNNTIALRSNQIWEASVQSLRLGGVPVAMKDYLVNDSLAI